MSFSLIFFGRFIHDVVFINSAFRIEMQVVRRVTSTDGYLKGQFGEK